MNSVNSESCGMFHVENLSVLDGHRALGMDNYNINPSDSGQKLKTYKELKEDYEKIMKDVKSESGVLDQLYTDLIGVRSDDEAIPMLEHMEDLLRKVSRLSIVRI